MNISFQIIPQLINWISILGVAVYALSGGVYTAEKEMDILGFLLIATVTAIGGGTLRDLLLDAPIFWVKEPFYIYIALPPLLLHISLPARYVCAIAGCYGLILPD